jgi:alkylation response protein AidB-like acyl-CoA dehydrogenase
MALAYVDSGPTTTCRDGRISGAKHLVVDGHTADLLLVTAEDEAGTLGLYAVEGDATGLVTASSPTFDPTRSLASMTFDAVHGNLVSADGSAVLEATLRVAAVLLAAEQLGGAEQCLSDAVQYAGLRTQFGRAIGSFQAVKHRCADMLVDVETARSAVLWALGDPSQANASLARAHVSEVFARVASGNVQVHGGIGFTWEHDAHLYLKRAKASEALLGTPRVHREVLARELLQTE